MPKIQTIEGIGGAYRQKLSGVGIVTTEALLERGATSKGRQELAETTGISAALILSWVNRADLYRIKGISEEYSDLLESAGVDTVPDLAQRNAENLHGKLVETNQQKRVVRRVPGLNQVIDWIAQAKELPRVVTY